MPSFEDTTETAILESQKEPDDTHRPITLDVLYRRARLDLLGLADAVEVLLRRRIPSRSDREFAQQRLARMRDRYEAGGEVPE